MYVTVIFPGLEEALAAAPPHARTGETTERRFGTLATWTMEEQSAKVRKLFFAGYQVDVRSSSREFCPR